MSCRAGRWLRRAALLGAALLLRRDSCSGNLGENEPRAVTFRLSVGTGTLEGNGASGPPPVSADGRYVVLSSRAQNLAAGSTDFEEIYFRDRFFDFVVNVSRSGDLRDRNAHRADCSNPAVSGDGRFVVFQTATEFDVKNDGASAGQTNLYVWDMATRKLRGVGYRVSSGDWPNPSLENRGISADGRYVAFQSKATDLGYGGAGKAQVYVADMNDDPPPYALVSHAAGTSSTPANEDAVDPHLSENGQVVVFASRDSTFVFGVSGRVHIFAGTAPRRGDVALVSRETGTAGTPFNRDWGVPFVKSGATHAAFISIATNLGGSGPAEESFLHDTRRVASPKAPLRSRQPSVRSFYS